MPFGQRNEEAQALAANGAHQAFAKCVRLEHLNRRSEDRQTHRRQCAIRALRENTVAIVDHVPNAADRPKCRPQALYNERMPDCPFVSRTSAVARRGSRSRT
jgi:hypothetical protein